LESFFFDWKGIPARTLFIIYRNKIHDAEYLVLASAVTLLSAVVAILARLTIAAPTNAKWKNVRAQTRPRNATQDVT